MIKSINTKWDRLKRRAEEDIKKVKGYDQIVALTKSEAEKTN